MSKNQSAVLIAEDNAEIAKLIKLYLEGEGYKTVWAEDGAVGLAAARNEAFSAVLVDIMMPKMNGYELIREIRAFSDVPILILSAKNEDNDKILGVNIGADDYITKPFNPLEMTARVNAAVRRYAAAGKTEVLKLKDLELDTSSCRLTKGGETIALTAKEYKILLLLMLSPGRIFSKKQIMVAVDGEDWLDDTAIAVHISHLRAKLETDGEAYIRTIKGLGYKIEN